MEPQLQNWENFCQYHAIGDWYGTWKKYSPTGEVIDAFQCVRSFHVSDDGNEIHHQNYYTYADGKRESKNFGSYKKPLTRALFLDNSFSWGSTTVESGSNFGFETGFRYKDRRASVVVMYDDSGTFEYLIVIPEQLANFAEQSSSSLVNEFNENCQGIRKIITPNWIVSSPVTPRWKGLEDLDKDNLILHFTDGISISIPPHIKNRNEFCLVVDWLINSTLLQRGIRNYNNESVFTGFTLETFTVGN